MVLISVFQLSLPQLVGGAAQRAEGAGGRGNYFELFSTFFKTPLDIVPFMFFMQGVTPTRVWVMTVVWAGVDDGLAGRMYRASMLPSL